MILINSQFLKIARDGVQEKINKRISIFKAVNPTSKVIELNHGDVVRPLAPCVVEAMGKALKEQSSAESFQGRGPVEGYSFLIEAIVKHDFKARKIKIDSSEIFINDGTKSELASIGDILCADNRIAVADPIYQTYIDANVIANRTGEIDQDGRWSHLLYMECPKQDDFMPEMLRELPEVIYLCYPNDPTGCAMSRKTMERWVQYALQNNILIIFDATYEAFITDSTIPHSIYEIKGARRCAIELRSYSKSAGFTGLHCGYTVIPKELSGFSFSANKTASLNELWRRRQEIKNYTPSYIVQRGAEALYTPAGEQSIRENVGYYMHNASLLRSALQNTRLNFWGGVNSPFIWIESPYKDSWHLFDKLLNSCNILSSPGERFGTSGKGFVRLSAFADQTQVTIASSRLSDLDI
ncbi:MAG: LL-diaminopimelate aminotransferase [Rikenellaceae bacterium]